MALVMASGFVINPSQPHLGASPDELVSCDCCGQGVLEIKCPYSHCSNTLTSSVSVKGLCLRKNESGEVELKRSHPYFYQVKSQMFTCGVEYCEFVVCTFSAVDGIFV